MFCGCEDGRGGGRVGAVGVEQHGNAHGAEESLGRGGQQFFAGSDV